ncbi:PKD domain-containing protein [Bauldia sp.]|uniref:PKD domain-containing protein n=1 Tax=Bauldia sp. TaxID=2575872 RepID=UPI003BAA5C62
MSRSTFVAFLALAAAFATPAPAVAQDTTQPLLVNYGAAAAPRQGDNDHAQAIYLSVPATTTGPLYVRVFDPDIGDSFDEVEGRANTRMRYALFGGPDAYVPEVAELEALTETERTAGELLADTAYRRDRNVDGAWVTIAEVSPDQGDLVGDQRIFRLLVEGTNGDDGNVYDVTVSTADDANVAPDDLRIFGTTISARMPRRGVITELRFMVPDDARAIVVGNFDAAAGEAFLTTKFISYPLESSDQGNWAVTTVPIRANDRGKMAAITLSGGQEFPNDATFYVTTEAGALIPFELPPRIFDLNGRPSAFGVADGMGTCMSVKFSGAVSSDPEGDPLTYVWHFGDGASEEAIATTHTYQQEGRFTAILEVFDSAPQLGNGAAMNVPVFVKNPPEAASDKRTLVAAAEENTFDGSPSDARQWRIARHQWDFGDGTRQEGEAVTHAYAEPGIYTVRHTVTDDSGHQCNTATEEFTVRVNAQPDAVAGTDRRISIDEETTLDAAASTDPDGALVTYAWDFGDGNTATGATVAHRYAEPATYTVTLRVRDDSDVANSGDTDTLTIIVNDPPIAEAGDSQSVAIEQPTHFDAAASLDNDGRLVAYAWDFGDGNTEDGPRSSHAYAAAGLYTVTLTITDDSTTDTSTAVDTLTVRVNQPPVSEAGPDQLVTASEVAFDGSGSGDADDRVAEYDWNFGDGNTGDGATPTHVYAKPGTYDVVLTVTDASGTIRSSASDRMRVIVNARPIADAGPDLVGAPGETLTFQGARSLDPDGSIAAYAWDFRDGNTATGQVVRHAFAEPGTYAVRLEVGDNTGHDEAIDFAETVAFINAPPVAVAGADVAAAPGEGVRLSAEESFDTDGTLIGYRWDFSDADEPMDGAVVTRTFDKPGIYTAQLTVTDDSGAQNAIATDTLEIAVNHQPVADAGPDVFTDRSTITFDGTRSVDGDGHPLAYTWDFGDGTMAAGAIVTHTYADGGTYPVVLTVDDGTGLANATGVTAMEVRINRPPVAVAGDNRQVCTGDIVVLDGSDSTDPEGGVLGYTWTFGDGTVANIVNPTKSYSKGGTYPVRLTVRDDSGLPNGVNTSELSVTVDQGPVANAGADILACARAEVAFDGSRSTDIDGVVNSFTWDFGDGNLGGGDTPVHIYDQPGTYRVFLTIEGEKAGICDSISRDEVEVTIIEGPVPVIDAPSAVPITEAVTFDASQSYMTDGNITGWQWDFGDGNTAAGATVTHQFAEAGTYPVSLTLLSDSTSPTCQRISAQHLITVNAPPVADAGDDPYVAVDEELVLDAAASDDPDGGIVAYAWDFGDGNTGEGIEVRHRYREAGIYTATLTIRDETDLANSTATDTVTVTVNPKPAPAVIGPDVVCVGETASWRAEGSGDDASFAWSFGNGMRSEGQEASHAFQTPGRHSLVLLADDGRGRANSNQQTTRIIHVNLPPHAEAGPDQMVCPGDVVRFDAGASADPDGGITAYRWDFGNGSQAKGETVEHAFDKPGTYTVTLTALDDAASACSATTDTLTVMVNATPEADAGADREVWIGGANDAVLLDGSASSDADGQALTHSWQIGDTDSAFGERVRHTLTTGGAIPVTLTVSDTSGLACGSASATVTITARER